MTREESDASAGSIGERGVVPFQLLLPVHILLVLLLLPLLLLAAFGFCTRDVVLLLPVLALFLLLFLLLTAVLVLVCLSDGYKLTICPSVRPPNPPPFVSRNACVGGPFLWGSPQWWAAPVRRVCEGANSAVLAATTQGRGRTGEARGWPWTTRHRLRPQAVSQRPQYTERGSLTSMGFTVMVKAESSQSISFSFPESWSRIVRWWAARIRNTPRIIMKTRKLTQTTITTVAVLGTTGRGRNAHIEETALNCTSPVPRQQSPESASGEGKP